MTPFYFGSRGRKLYAVWHQSERRVPGAPAVLVCQPFGQEYIRCHRMLRVLAGRLARQGNCSLRFDYLGTGDSDGADEDSRLTGWVEDVLTAHHELVRRAGSGNVVWLGVRLGAAAALLASQKLTEPPAGLVLWEPIGSGSAYLTELAVRHREALATSYSLVPGGLPTSDEGELLGFGLGDDMRHELTNLRLQRSLEGADLPPSMWIMPPSPPPYLATPPSSPGVITHRLEHPFEWNAEESLDTALVPPDAVTLLLQACVSFP